MEEDNNKDALHRVRGDTMISFMQLMASMLAGAFVAGKFGDDVFVLLVTITVCFVALQCLGAICNR